MPIGRAYVPAWNELPLIRAQMRNASAESITSAATSASAVSDAPHPGSITTWAVSPPGPPGP